MSLLYQWAASWGVGLAAVKDLEARLGLVGAELEPAAATVPIRTEADVQAHARYEAALHGARIWRNNVGALVDERGVPVRYGLCNDTAALNKKVKSADLIGVRPVVITAAMVGHTVGQFVSRECKAPGWTWRGTDREQAQLNWANIVNGLGGDAKFITGPGSFNQQ